MTTSRRGGADDPRTIIKDAFVRLYEQTPLKGISGEGLAREAGYSRAAFYRYYHNVDEVLSEVEDDMLPTAESSFITEHAAIITPSLFVELYLEYFARTEDRLRVVLARDEGRLYHKLAETITPSFRALAQLKLADDVSADEVARLTDYLVDTKMNQLRGWAANPTEPLADHMRLPLQTVERSFWGEG